MERGQIEPKPSSWAPEERIGHLHKDAGTIACVRVSACGSTVCKIDEHLDATLNDVVRTDAFRICDHTNATSGMLEFRPVKAEGFTFENSYHQ
jgi:hypothetical protein